MLLNSIIVKALPRIREYIIPTGGNYSVLASGNKGGTFDLRNILIINNNTKWNGVDLFDETNAGVFTFNVAGGTYNNGNPGQGKGFRTEIYHGCKQLANRTWLTTLQSAPSRLITITSTSLRERKTAAGLQETSLFHLHLLRRLFTALG